MPIKSINDKYCHDQVFINKVVQILTFHFSRKPAERNHNKSDLIFIPLQLAYKIFMKSEIKIQAFCNNCVKLQRDLLITNISKLTQKNWLFFHSNLIFWDMWDVGAVAY